MKQSTKTLVLVVLNLIWALTTMFAVANNTMIMTDAISIFMVLMPFIAFFGTLVIYHLEYKSEQNIK
jgi:hypothetical protein